MSAWLPDGNTAALVTSVNDNGHVLDQQNCP